MDVRDAVDSWESTRVVQSFHRIATVRPRTVEKISEQVALAICDLLKVSCARVSYKEGNELKSARTISGQSVLRENVCVGNAQPCAIYRRGRGCPIFAELGERDSILTHWGDGDFKSCLGVVVRNGTGGALGVLCAMSLEERRFRGEEGWLLDILGNWMAHEIELKVARAQLRESGRMQALGQLLCGVAHEVRNPLNAILAITDALYLDLGEDPEYAPYLERIRTQVGRLAGLMNDLLNLGKPLEPSNLRKLSMVEVCAEAIELWQHSTTRRTHRAVLNYPSECPNLYVIGDGARLQQVFINLLENAAQHSPDGSDILLNIFPPDNGMLRIRVVDRGTGVPVELMSRIFTPFFTTRSKGTGLGLSIVKHVVERHGGRVELWNNQPPPGCTVEVSLPMVKEGEP